jgi:hypothetical protein
VLWWDLVLDVDPGDTGVLVALDASIDVRNRLAALVGVDDQRD